MAWSDEALLGTVNSLVAATLISAGLGKLVAPSRLGQALAEVRAPDPLRTVGAVRLYAVVECLAGLALLFAATRQPGGALASAIGLAITGLGGLGLARGSSSPCGCFGNAAGPPLGWTNVALGVSLAVAGIANVVQRPATGSAPLLGAALAMLLLCLFVNRSWAWPLIRPRRGTMS
jgi:hypothetical protein